MNTGKFPILATIARKYLSIVSISALSESIFSQSSDIITKKRNKLTKQTFNQIICLKNWGEINNKDINSDEEDIEGDKVWNKIY